MKPRNILLLWITTLLAALLIVSAAAQTDAQSGASPTGHPTAGNGGQHPAQAVDGVSDSATVAELAAAETLSQPDTESRLRSTVSFLAGPDCAGRRTGTDGAEAAAAFLEAVFTKMGLQPAPGLRGFRQGFSLTKGIQVVGEPRVAIAGQELASDQDYTVAGFSGSGHTQQAPLVFAGYGIVAPELKWNSYEQLDVGGAAVVILRGEPRENDPDSVFAGLQPSVYSDLRRKAATARDLGASALLVVNNPLTAPDDNLPELRPTYSAASFDIPVIHVRRELLVNALIGATGLSWHEIAETIDLENRPHSAALEAAVLDIDLEVEKELATGYNIVGVVPGADPRLADEWVILGAHYDHIGIGGPESSQAGSYGQVHPGADDNASGVAAAIEVARRAHTAGGLAGRSLLIGLYAGEELGLLGSAALARDLPVPSEQVHSMVNLDMIGHLREGRVITGGADSAEELAGLLEAPAAAHGLHTDADLSGLGGSDHLSFLRIGIPALFFTTGGFDGYHSPDDTADRVNYTGLADVAAFTYDLVSDLASWPAALTFNPEAAPAVGSGGQRAGLKVTMGTVPHFGSEPPVPGMQIDDVIADGPAERAGLQGGDVIVKILDWKISSIQDFMYALQDCSPGQVVPVAVWRDGEQLDFEVELTARSIER